MKRMRIFRAVSAVMILLCFAISVTAFPKEAKAAWNGNIAYGQGWQNYISPGSGIQDSAMAYVGDTLYVVYVDSSGMLYIKSSISGGTWQTAFAFNMTPVDQRDVDLTADNGVLYTAFRATNGVVYVYKSNNLAENPMLWSRLGTGLPGTNAEAQQLCVENGIPYIAYKSAANGYVYVYKYYNDAWSRVGSDLPAAVTGDHILGFDVYNGQPAVAYRDYNSNRGVIRIYKNNAWGDYNTAMVPGVLNYQQIAFDEDGYLYACCNSASPSYFSLIRFNPQGSGVKVPGITIATHSCVDAKFAIHHRDVFVAVYGTDEDDLIWIKGRSDDTDPNLNNIYRLRDALAPGPVGIAEKDGIPCISYAYPSPGPLTVKKFVPNRSPEPNRAAPRLCLSLKKR